MLHFWQFFDTLSTAWFQSQDVIVGACRVKESDPEITKNVFYSDWESPQINKEQNEETLWNHFGI